MMMNTDTRSPACASTDAYGLMDIFHLDENAIIEDGIDEDGNLDAALTFKDLLSSETSLIIHEIQNTDTYQNKDLHFGEPSGLEPFRPSGLGGASLELFMEESEDLAFDRSGMESCLSSSGILGSFVSNLENHGRDCQKDGSDYCCCLVQPGMELDFLVEQDDLDDCDCLHKKPFWICVKQLPSFKTIGAMEKKFSRVLSPLILAGYVTISGQVVNSGDGDTIDLDVTLRSNLDFVLMMGGSITRQQTEAFGNLVDLVNFEDGVDQRFLSFLNDLKEVEQNNPTVEPQTCLKCQSLRSPPVYSLSRKRLRPQEVVQNDIGRSEQSSATLIKTMLEERRRKRAREQIANCTMKDVSQFRRVIETTAKTSSRKIRDMYNKRNGSRKVREFLEEVAYHIDSGKDALGGIGELMGVTQTLFALRSSGDEEMGSEWEEVFRIWENVTTFRDRQIGKPLSRLLGDMLRHSESQRNDLQGELSVLLKLLE